MKTKKMLKVINAAIALSQEQGAEPDREGILIELLTAGAKASTSMSAITKAFKAAGIITVTSNAALAECREYLKTSMPDMEHYSDMTTHAADMQEKFDINEDNEKGIASALNLIKKQLKDNDLMVPKKVQLGIIKEIMLDYFLDTEPTEMTVENLTEYLCANIDPLAFGGEEEAQKKFKITAGTYFNFAKLIVTGQRLDEVN